MLSESEQIIEESYSSDKGVTCIFGMYFCDACSNMLHPYRANEGFLEFKCYVCGSQQIDFKSRYGEQCMIYTKELQVGTKKYVADTSYIFDPTMPSVKVNCPECGYDRAVYFLSPDETESKILARMICMSSTGTTPKCGHVWNLDESDNLLRSRVLTEDEQILEVGKRKL